MKTKVGSRRVAILLVGLLMVFPVSAAWASSLAGPSTVPIGRGAGAAFALGTINSTNGGSAAYAMAFTQAGLVDDPEPATLALFGTGLIGVGMLVRRRLTR